MKISIDIDKIHPSYEESVSTKLKEAKLPSCFGLMVLPLLHHVEVFEDSDIFVVEKSIPKERKVNIDLKELVGGSEALVEGKAITSEGFSKIVNVKERKVDLYVSQSLACSTCKLYDICYKLTRNTLLSVQLYKEAFND